jgi:IclR family transcriptional regulator, KDG regulon repressor
VEPFAVAETVKTTKSLTLSVQKALRLLSSFSVEKPELSLVEIASETGLSVSTTHRLLATLEAEQFIERMNDSGHYRLAIKMFELGSVVLNRMELNIVGTPVLARLATETEDTAYLSVLCDDSVLCIARIEGSRHLRSQFLAVGRHLPLHAGAASKALLAHLPEARVRHLIDRYPLTSYTDKTITNTEAFLKHLVEVRVQGYALSDEEVTRGITAIAAPIVDLNGRVISAISLAGAAGRFGPGNRPFLVSRVKEAASQISARLGYMPALTL